MFTAELNFVWIQHELFVCRYLFLGYEDYYYFYCDNGLVTVSTKV